MRNSTYHRLACQLKALADRLCGARSCRDSCAAAAHSRGRRGAGHAQAPDVWRAGGRLVFMLEGGYDLKALGESVAETFRGLLGQVCGRARLRAADPP